MNVDYCEQVHAGFEVPGVNPGSDFGIMVTVDVADFHALRSVGALNDLLSHVIQSAVATCRDRGRARANFILVTIVALTPNGFNVPKYAVIHAGKLLSAPNWTIDTNRVAEWETFERQQNEKQQREADAAQKQAQELADARATSQKLQSDFKAQTALEAWVNLQVLKANPFPYQGKVVGFMTTFQQMVGSGVAMFGGNMDVVASGVPNTQFTQPGAATILAVQVNGVKQVKILGTDMNAVDGTYRGAYVCKTQNCAEFIGPH
jgi:hypothetical protein